MSIKDIREEDFKSLKNCLSHLTDEQVNCLDSIGYTDSDEIKMEFVLKNDDNFYYITFTYFKDGEFEVHCQRQYEYLDEDTEKEDVIDKIALYFINGLYGSFSLGEEHIEDWLIVRKNQHPKYKFGDRVSFKYDNNEYCGIVEASYNEVTMVYYDINVVYDTGCQKLYKDVAETMVINKL